MDGVDVRFPESARVTSGERVTLCVRPESLHLGPGETTLEATVATSEFIGDAYRVHCNWRGRTLLVKTADREAPEGSVRLGFGAGDVHLLRE